MSKGFSYEPGNRAGSVTGMNCVVCFFLFFVFCFVVCFVLFCFVFAIVLFCFVLLLFVLFCFVLFCFFMGKEQNQNGGP